MGRIVVKLKDRYLEWSGVVDAPVSWAYDREDAVKAFGAERVQRADERGTSAHDLDPVDGAEFVRANRAGPREICLTVDAILECYDSARAHETFELTPDKIEPCTLQEVDGSVWWVPWAPGHAPEQLPADFFDRRHQYREPYEPPAS